MDDAITHKGDAIMHKSDAIMHKDDVIIRKCGMSKSMTEKHSSHKVPVSFSSSSPPPKFPPPPFPPPPPPPPLLPSTTHNSTLPLAYKDYTDYDSDSDWSSEYLVDSNRDLDSVDEKYDGREKQLTQKGKYLDKSSPIHPPYYLPPLPEKLTGSTFGTNICTDNIHRTRFTTDISSPKRTQRIQIDEQTFPETRNNVEEVDESLHRQRVPFDIRNQYQHNVPYSEENIRQGEPFEENIRVEMSEEIVLSTLTRCSIFMQRTSTYPCGDSIAKNSWRHILPQKVQIPWQKLVGIPFAVIYHFVLVWIISSFIIDPHDVSSDKYDAQSPAGVAKNICNLIFPHVNSTNGTLHDAPFHPFKQNTDRTWNTDDTRTSSGEEVRIVTPKSDKQIHQTDAETTTQKTHSAYNIVFDNDFHTLHIAVGVVMGVISALSVFSRRTRATLLLMLPGLITSRSRHGILTITLGMLVNGPVLNIRHNFHKLMDNGVCMYASVFAMACIKVFNNFNYPAGKLR